MSSTASTTPRTVAGSKPSPRQVAERVQERIGQLSDAELSNLADHPDTSPSLVARVNGEQQSRATKPAVPPVKTRKSRATRSAEQTTKTTATKRPKLVAAQPKVTKSAPKDPGPTTNEVKGVAYSAMIRAVADMVDAWTNDPRAIKRGKPGHPTITREQVRAFAHQRMSYGPAGPSVVWDDRLGSRSNAGRRPTAEPEPVKVTKSTARKSTARTAQTAPKGRKSATPTGTKSTARKSA